MATSTPREPASISHQRARAFSFSSLARAQNKTEKGTGWQSLVEVETPTEKAGPNPKF
jgi:hypothetical protein